MADEALQQEEELTEVELPETEDEQEEEVVEDEPQEKEEAKKSEEIEDYSESVQKRIAKLTFKIREAERREQAAVDYAKSVQDELNKTKNKLSKTDQNLYDEYKGRVGSELQYAQDRYKKAYENGDTDAMLEAQKQIAKLAVEEESLNRVRAKQPEVQEQVVDVDKEIQSRIQPQQQVQVQADPKAQEWAKKNSWFGSDVAMTTSAFAFHRQLVEQEGYDPTSDEYYSEVDKRMAEAFPHKLGKTQQNTVNEVVAGSSRGSTTARTRSRRKVQLTPSQVAIAKRLGVPLEEYAKHVKE
jgi:hypothetical protein